MVIPLLANQDLTPMLIRLDFALFVAYRKVYGAGRRERQVYAANHD